MDMSMVIRAKKASMRPLALSALLSTPREDIEKNQELILPAATTVFGAVHTWPKYTPMLAYDMLIKYHMPRQYNTVALSTAISVQYLVGFHGQAQRICAIVDLMDNIGFFETKSGRDTALDLLKVSLVPVTLKRRNDIVNLEFLHSPYYRECIEAIEEIIRTSYTYDVKGDCVTVNNADVRRIAGLPAVE